MTAEQKENIIKAIAYSRLVQQTFSPEQCIALQQWIGRGIRPCFNLRQKLDALSIQITKWERPKLRYNESRELLIWNPETELWTKIDN